MNMIEKVAIIAGVLLGAIIVISGTGVFTPSDTDDSRKVFITGEIMEGPLYKAELYFPTEMYHVEEGKALYHTKVQVSNFSDETGTVLATSFRLHAGDAVYPLWERQQDVRLIMPYYYLGTQEMLTLELYFLVDADADPADFEYRYIGEIAGHDVISY